MKILYIQFPNPWNIHSHGGMNTVSHEVLKRLASNHEITVYTGYLPERVIEKSGIKYIHKAFGKNRWINRFSFSVYSLFHDTSKFDVIVLPWNRYAPIFTKTPNQKEVLELHADEFHAPSKAPILESLTRYLLKRKIIHSKNIICNSKAVLNGVESYCKQKIPARIIYNGVNQNENTPVNREQKYFLYLGRLDILVKGIDFLLKAYKKSKLEAPLIIAGDGKDKNVILNMIKTYELESNVKLVGWKEGQAKINLIQQALAVIIPSRTEGWGLVALEAAVEGIPSIATNIGGLTEFVENKVTGLIVDPRDVDGLISAMTKISQNRNFRQRLGYQASLKAKNFTWELTAQNRLEFFEEILQENI